MQRYDPSESQLVARNSQPTIWCHESEKIDLSLAPNIFTPINTPTRKQVSWPRAWQQPIFCFFIRRLRNTPKVIKRMFEQGYQVCCLRQPTGLDVINDYWHFYSLVSPGFIVFVILLSRHASNARLVSLDVPSNPGGGYEDKSEMKFIHSFRLTNSEM